MRFKNNVTLNLEYRQSRILSLSVLNSQLTQQNEDDIVFGFGYKTKNFRFPFGLFNNTILKNDLTFKVDFALRDNKTLIYQADVTGAQISSGAQILHTARQLIMHLAPGLTSIYFTIRTLRGHSLRKPLIQHLPTWY